MRRICIYCQTWESGGIEAFINNILQHMDLSELEIDVVVDSLKGSVFTMRRHLMPMLSRLHIANILRVEKSMTARIENTLRVLCRQTCAFLLSSTAH